MAEDKNALRSKVLGLETDELADLTVEELHTNQTAIKMLLHYYRQLVDENNSLKNDNNTLKTYMDAYNRFKTNAAIGGALLAVSTISIGFGVNLLTVGSIWPGIASFVVGLSLIVTGIYFSFIKRT